jgi:predicted nucleic acid-binding protein
MVYVDTSILVAALTRERHTPRAQAWLAGQEPGELSISEWVITEFSSALSLKLRTGQITPAQRADSLSAFTELTETSFHVLPVSGVDFRVAARFVDQQLTGLRAGDALHLAIASHHGARLRALDQGLVAAAAALGVSAALI